MPARIKASQIPDKLLRDIKGLPKRKASKIVGWEDIPESWVKCREHGWASSGGECPGCEDERGMGGSWLDESLGLDERLAGVSWVAFGVRTYILAQCDSAGRFPRDPRIIKAKCMTMRFDARLEAIEEALLELEQARCLHRYMQGGKDYIVLHEYKMPGALGRATPKYPAPPPGLCECTREDVGNREQPREYAPPPSSSGFEGGVPSGLNLLLQRARGAKIANRMDTIRSYIEAWVARSNMGRVEEVLMDPWTRGKTVIEIQDRFFKGEGGASWEELMGGKSK